jgi:dihydroxyacetone kinase
MGPASGAAPTILAAADAIDLLDSMSVKLEQARSVTWAVSEQIERSMSNHSLGHNICGEMGTVYTQLVEVQDLVEQLFASLMPPRSIHLD